MTRISLLLIITPALIAATLYSWIRYVWCVLVNPVEAWRMAVAFDQLANAAANGSEDETISSRAARAQREGRRWGCILCRALDLFEKDHCTKSEGV